MQLCWDVINDLNIYLTSRGNLYSRKLHKTIYEKECPQCRRSFLARRRENKNGTGTGQEFCSRSCANLYRKGHGYFIDVYGYCRIFDFQRREWKGKHQLKAEKVLGRQLKKGEVTHHMNGDQSDNDNRNLLICSVAYHKWLHHEMSRRYMKEYFPNYKTCSKD